MCAVCACRHGAVDMNCYYEKLDRVPNIQILDASIPGDTIWLCCCILLATAGWEMQGG